jgi:hypothetical protein
VPTYLYAFKVAFYWWRITSAYWRPDGRIHDTGRTDEQSHLDEGLRPDDERHGGEGINDGDEEQGVAQDGDAHVDDGDDLRKLSGGAAEEILRKKKREDRLSNA